jgi:hypothetical protein
MVPSILKTVDVKSIKNFLVQSLKEAIHLKKTRKKENEECLDETQELINLLRNTKSQWRDSISNYEYVTDEELVDYYTYQIKAQEMRFKYLLKKAKAQGIRAKIYNGL